jgi:Ni/Co efflux regulator RcnB
MQKIWLRSKLLVAVLIALGFFAGTVAVRADDRGNKRCEQQIHRAQENLDKAVRRYGEHSRQAEQKRRELEQTRERCHHDDHH